jgi:hypothetical protein
MKSSILRSLGLTAIVVFFATTQSFGQMFSYFKRPFEPQRGYLVSVQYNLQNPAGDMADRFGLNSGLTFDLKFKNEKGWIWGASYTWMFSRNVREVSMFDSILGPSGEIIDSDGIFSVIRLNQRGHLIFLEGGKIFQLSSINRNSGIVVHFGAGAMLHRIDIQASTLKVPQITGDYENGYDRFTGGPALAQYLGYQYLDPKKRINFNIGFTAHQGFTRSLRPIDFDTREYNDARRVDLLYGLRVGIAVPIYTKRPDDEMFFDD